MRRYLRKRIGTVLLALVLALSLLPAGALAEETEGTVTEERPREAETLAEIPAEAEEAPEENPPAPEEDRDGQAPASTSADGDTTALQSNDNIKVTTNSAEQFSAFSANLSLEIADSSSDAYLWRAMENGGQVGFEYTNTPGATPSVSDGISKVQWSDDHSSLTYTYTIDCVPETTYRFRAFFQEQTTDGSAPSFVYGEWCEFTSDVFPSGAELKPNTPTIFSLEAGQEQYLNLTAETSGFYRLSYTVSVDGTGESLTAWNDDWLGWETLFPSTPIYIEAGSKQFAKFTLTYVPGQEDRPVSADVTITLESYPWTDLLSGTPSGSVSAAAESTYFRFTPEKGGNYLVTIETAGENSGGISGSVSTWDPVEKNWTSHSQGFTGTWRRVIRISDPQYFQLSVWGGGPAEMTISPYDGPVDSLSVESGSFTAEDGFSVTIPITVTVPLGTVFEAGIEYQVGGITIEPSVLYGTPQDNASVYWASCQLETLPGTEYRYRAYLKVTGGDDGTGEPQTIREDWKSPPTSPAEITTLTLAEEQSFEHRTLFQFTAPEIGYYDISGTHGNLYRWDGKTLSWSPCSLDEQQSPLLLTPETPLYIRADVDPSSNPPGTVTISKSNDSVEEFSIAAELVTISPWDFTAQFHFTGALPGSSNVCLLLDYFYTSEDGRLNGSGTREYFPNLESEYLNLWDSLHVLPDMTYNCTPLLCRFDQQGQPDRSSVLVWGDPVTFKTGDLPVTVLELNTPVEFEAENCQKLLCFTPKEGGCYKIEAAGVDPWSLMLWSAELGGWKALEGSTDADSAVTIVAGTPGVPQYFYLYLTESTACTVTVTEYTSAVTEFGVTTGMAETETPGFRALVPVEVVTPIGSSCRVELQVQYGQELREISSQEISQSGTERRTVRCPLDTLPEKTYRYRARLFPLLDGSGPTDKPGEPAYGEPVEGDWVDFTAEAFSTDTLQELPLGQEVSSDDSGTQAKERIFYFEPEEDGLYEVTLTGAKELERADLDRGTWVCHTFGNGSNTFQMKADTTEFFRIPPESAFQYTLRISLCTSEGADFGIQTEKEEGGLELAWQSGLELSVPVKTSAPFGARFIYGVRYWLQDGADGGERKTVSKEIDSNTTANIFETFDIPVLPGKNYFYQAFLKDPETEQEYLDGPYSFVTKSQAEMEDTKELTGLTEGEWREPTDAGLRGCYFFVPSKSGTYCFEPNGREGTLTVLFEDGRQELFSYGSQRSMTLGLAAGVCIYLIHTERLAGSASLMVNHQPLNAVYQGGAVSVSLETEEPGQYVFAVYDDARKLLSLSVKAKESTSFETLTATLTGVSGSTAFVKVFFLDNAHRPAGPAREMYVPRT